MSRLFLEMGKELGERVDRLVKTCGARDKAEMVAWAISCYESLWDNEKSGGRTVLEGSDGESYKLILRP